MNRQFTVLILFLVCLTPLRIHAGWVIKKEHDKEYLSKAKYIKIESFDTLDSFKCKNSQAFYATLFLEILKLGINGFTHYELLEKGSEKIPDLILKFKFVDLKYSDKFNPVPKGIYYKTSCTMEIEGLTPETKELIFELKQTRSSTMYRYYDELKDNVIEIAEDLIKYLKNKRMMPSIKSFYYNDIICEKLSNCKISYLIYETDRKDYFNQKLLTVVNAELQNCLYNNDLFITRLNNPLDSLICLENKKIQFKKGEDIFSSEIQTQLNKSKIDFLLVLHNLTSFENYKFLDEKPFFGDKHFFAVPLPGPGVLIGVVDGDEPTADLEEMNRYDRIYCKVSLIDIKNNRSILYSELFSLRNIDCDFPERCIVKRVLREIGSLDKRNSIVHPCFAGKKKKRRRRK